MYPEEICIAQSLLFGDLMEFLMELHLSINFKRNNARLVYFSQEENVSIRFLFSLIGDNCLHFSFLWIQTITF